MFSIESVMSKELVTILPTGSLADARELMQSHRIHHLPVVNDDGELVGLLTLTDLLGATDSVLRGDADRLDAKDIRVADVMVTNVATIDEQADLRQTALFLEKYRIGCMPVVVDGQLKGIITDTDFVAIAINLLELLEETDSVDEQYA